MWPLMRSALLLILKIQDFASKLVRLRWEKMPPKKRRKREYSKEEWKVEVRRSALNNAHPRVIINPEGSSVQEERG